MDEDTRKRIEENRPLIEEHPFLVPLWGHDPESEYDGSYTILDLAPMGWSQLIIDMCSEIEAHAREAGIDLSKIGVYDIKEKYGELRIEAGGEGYDGVCQDIVESYCEKSMLYCPACGKPTKYISEGWIYYLCPECAAQAKTKTRPLTAADIPYYTYVEYDEKTQTKTKTYTRPTHHDAQFRAQWDGKGGGKD